METMYKRERNADTMYERETNTRGRRIPSCGLTNGNHLLSTLYPSGRYLVAHARQNQLF